ncbi:hypothetical protein LPTSP4_19890 [Leptospira ryugenii]|uniref:PPM-type phosphatase domain-containing protein n=2 Tax=Leptospira ryugenii TaxID=1917863 RepID=A0A2P2E0Q1_9LEPT|nr:hypothetical protein LPTSP4_19890 [Leptospira ryugenii]
MGIFAETEFIRKFYIANIAKNIISEETTIVTVFWLAIGLFANFTIVFRFVQKSLEENQKATFAKEKAENYLYKLKKDLRFAGNIQRNLLPSQNFQFDEIQFSTWIRPLTEVGGDTFGIVPLQEKKLRIFLVDATGHGIEAALMTLLIRSELLKFMYQSIPLHDVLNQFNKVFIENYQKLGYFCTIALLEIDLSSKTLVYSSAGHPTQYLRNGNQWHHLQSYGRIIGLSKESEFESVSLPLQDSFTFFLFSDGVFEEISKDGTLYGEVLLERDLQEISGLSPEDICQTIEARLEEHRSTKGYRDDISLVVGKANLAYPSSVNKI